MNKLKLTVLALATGIMCVAAQAEVSSEVTAIIDGAGLNNRQKSAVTQYAESLDAILNVDLNNRDSVIAVNKEFMSAQACLAHIYGYDQKPHMMRVSRKVHEATFNTQELTDQYHLFLGQAQQEGRHALPSDRNVCK